MRTNHVSEYKSQTLEQLIQLMIANAWQLGHTDLPIDAFELSDQPVNGLWSGKIQYHTPDSTELRLLNQRPDGSPFRPWRDNQTR